MSGEGRNAQAREDDPAGHDRHRPVEDVADRGGQHAQGPLHAHRAERALQRRVGGSQEARKATSCRSGACYGFIVAKAQDPTLATDQAYYIAKKL